MLRVALSILLNDWSKCLNSADIPNNQFAMHARIQKISSGWGDVECKGGVQLQTRVGPASEQDDSTKITIIIPIP